MKEEGQIKITLKKSPIGKRRKHRAILESLGLTKLNKTVYKPNHPTIMGMIKKVEYMVDYQLVKE